MKRPIRRRTYHRKSRGRPVSVSLKHFRQTSIAVLYLFVCPILAMASYSQGRMGLAWGYLGITIAAYIAAFTVLIVGRTAPVPATIRR